MSYNICCFQLLAVFQACCIIFTTARPQYNYNNPSTSAAYGPAPAPTQSNGAGCCGDQTGAPAPAYQDAYSADANAQSNAYQGAGGGGGGGAGGNLNVKCEKRPGPNGRLSFICRPLSPELITLKSEHILWLPGPKGGAQALEIEVPNYKVDELIKAGFKKGGAGGSTRINVLLKKPEQAYGAVAEETPSIDSDAEVNLQYEPVGPVQIVHFPNDKQYNPLTGPILPPDNGSGGSGGGGGNRYNRQVQVVQPFQASKPVQKTQQQGQQQNHQQQQQQSFLPTSVVPRKS